ncbi:Asp23/Gls24 family envelope stress response protein [Peptostreptococcus equinus]|uniref:Asp23/Gls24 family envelope stress response protein n=1 Tax=Peptostreptococcus equinus TaxID=3003601 RepID=A0ABY7JMQ7_9FIRM|nr:Asp23/Gls24 family envelope stress response protein [Peptostreptococcus sp. CBA3647]WAW14649.1 Asp23/Gls24 family envelope stress response protein [Peptostreptococcus sp. CBA3647]
MNNNDMTVRDYENNSTLVFDEQVIVKIVSMALRDIEGAAIARGNSNAFSGIVGRGSSEGINVEVGTSEVAVDLRLIIEYGKNARAVYEQIKAKIENEVMSMTGLRVVEVNARIEDVFEKEEFQARTQL